jgi:N4-gp56 family major capsid protein
MAKGTTEFIDTTTADYFLGEVWSQLTNDAREANLVFGKLFDRKLEPELRKGQKIHLGNITNLTATAKSANTAVTYETVTETGNDLTVDQYYYAAFAIEDIIKVQSMIDLLMKYTKKLGYAIALQEDDFAASFVDDFSNYVGTLASALDEDNILRADQYLNDANAPQNDRFIVISPAEKANFLKNERFTSKDYGPGNAVATGGLGEIYGYKVHVSTNVEGDNTAGHDNAVFQKEAVELVSQEVPKLVSFYDIDYLADKVVATTLYGGLEVREDHGVWAKGA